MAPGVGVTAESVSGAGLWGAGVEAAGVGETTTVDSAAGAGATGSDAVGVVTGAGELEGDRGGVEAG
jgi:hypothetical protein